MAKPNPQPVPPGTLIETEDDIRQALLANKAAVQSATPITKKLLTAPAPAPSKPSEVKPFRPTLRPPICVLTLFDDGKTEGEVVRIRANRFVIGRTDGDLLLPHDELISSRHLEITRQLVNGQQRWVVTDLQSTNGLFLRVSRTVLSDKAEFLVGKGRYRFEQAGLPPTVTEEYLASAPAPPGTIAFGGSSPLGLHPALVEIVPGGFGNRIVLAKPEYWIGTDSSCGICRTDDPFAEPRHAHLCRDAKGAWSAQNSKSLNGLWLRIPQLTIEDSCLMQIGEQRFRLKVGG